MVGQKPLVGINLNKSAIVFDKKELIMYAI